MSKKTWPKRIVVAEGYPWVHTFEASVAGRDGYDKLLRGATDVNPVARYRLVLERLDKKP